VQEEGSKAPTGPAWARPSKVRLGLGRGGAKRLLAFGAALALVAGCSSSTKSQGSVGAGGGGGTAKGTPIPVGVIGSFTGSQSSSISTALSAIQAWSDSVNATGGLSGHPIRLIVKEDNDSPSLGSAAAHELINQDHVVAILADWSDVDSSWLPFAKTSGIPVIGGTSIAGFGDTDYFPAQTTVLAGVYGELYGVKQKGLTRLGVAYCAEIAACSQALPLTKDYATKLGMSVVWSGAFSATAPDLTPQCLGMKQANVQAILPAAPSDADIHLAEACYQQGLRAVYGTSSETLSNDWLAVPAFNGTIAEEGNAPWFDNSTPALMAFHAALAKFAPGKPLNPASIDAWAAGKLFEAAVAASGSTTVTTSSVLTGLYSLKNETLGGIAPALNFTKGSAATVNCFFLVGVSGGKFTEPQGLNTSCAPS